MKKLLITFPENVSSALGYTLLHSLWQGAFILLVFWLLSLGIKQSRHKYNLAMGSLMLLLTVSGATFYYLYQPVRSFGPVESNSFLTGDTLWMDSTLAVKQGVWDSFLAFINLHIDQVALLWSLGVVFLLCRMSLGLLFIEKLKKTSLPLINEKAQEMMQQIRSRVGLSAAVKLAETKEITVPVTVGWIKPVVLFPVGMLSGLSVQHLEAILAHELAHIKRNDYLVNIFQSFAEVLFFFNPFVWILSSRIRAERENCCDDIALEICGNRLVLARALVQVADYAVPFAMAFGKKSDSLLIRVKRIAGVSPSGYFNPANVLGVLFVISLFFGGVVYAKKEILQEPELKEEITGQEHVQVYQEVKETATVVTAKEDTLNVKMEKLQKEIQALSGEIQKYSEKISGISSKMQATHVKEIEKLSQEIREKAEKIEMPVLQQQELAIQRMQLDLESRKLSRRNDLSELEKGKQEQQLEEKRKHLEKSLENSNSQLQELQNQITVLQEKISKEQLPIAQMQAEISKNHAPIDSLSRVIRVKSEEIRILAEKQRLAMEKSMNDFMQALTGTGLIPDKEDVTIKINGDELTVNGTVRSQADYEKVWELLNRHFIDKEYVDKKYLEARDFSIVRKDGKLSWRFRNGRSNYMNNWSSDY